MLTPSKNFHVFWTGEERLESVEKEELPRAKATHETTAQLPPLDWDLGCSSPQSFQVHRELHCAIKNGYARSSQARSRFAVLLVAVGILLAARVRSSSAPRYATGAQAPEDERVVGQLCLGLVAPSTLDDWKIVAGILFAFAGQPAA